MLAPCYSFDDCVTSAKAHPNQAVDYFSSTLSDHQYFKGWQQVRSKCPEVKQSLRHTLPSTCIERLENVIWRKWYKVKNQSGELNPEEINWFKENDITCLYGPLFAHKEISPPARSSSSVSPLAIPSHIRRSESTDSLDSFSSYESEHMMEIHSRTSSASSCSPPVSDEFIAYQKNILYDKPRSILKQDYSDLPHYNHVPYAVSCKRMAETPVAQKMQRRRIQFNHVVSKREIINTQFYDYSYLDYELLH
ncbi:hypothetical protein BABINDRAFT_160566 [Babjeviella inositovora NRRL Y-12698]|uniref:Nitrogen regulatory protein areA GATA-like domain-containing protein n=1 Tax=Babjeviella inositovora NRRL Y-12698 TaxID=984486 RepID=A0A1E3QU33_9ASCO|nr:uncharacterized protein BABINDRAFT_160566 [Babjeviella inositovora NRRL Y-12698]ODQ81170.1 hypothetical protein BABINDRAFT_160566 [Babjeviella inositovora NRRL Y-12698]